MQTGSCGYSGGVSWTDNNKKEFVTMIQKHMFMLNDEGYIPFPNTTKRVWIDIGSHARSILDSCGPCRKVYWPQRSSRSLQEEFLESEDLYIIAIDPNVRFYKTLSNITRLIPIIAAIFPTEGIQIFYEYEGDFCSSLLGPNNNIGKQFANYPWFAPCTKVKRTTAVSTLRLETILSLVHPRLNIELVKIDAQGVDLQAMKSAGHQLSRISKVIIEVQADRKNNLTSHILYANSDKQSETLKWMDENGFEFEPVQSTVENEAISEYNYVFNSRNRIKA